MDSSSQISEDFILPLFNEIFVVKERDFSIEYKPLGEGRQKLLMLVESVNSDFGTETELQLLTTIIEKGLRKTLDDVWVVNHLKFPQEGLDTLLEFFQPVQVIIWGCPQLMKKSALSLEIHRQITLGGVDALLASPLISYLSDNAAKAKLWAALQRMFFN